MDHSVRTDYETLLAHWNRVFDPAEEGAGVPQDAAVEEDWKDLAPSRKLLQAAQDLGACRNVLDYGSGSGWAGIAIAKAGCPSVTCADPAPNAQRLAAANAGRFHVEDKLQPVRISDTWLSEVPAGGFDGLFCSNVLDVIPPAMTEDILRHAARVLKEGSPAVIGLNYWMPPEAAEKRGFDLREGRCVYVDGVLRLVTRTDEEWQALLGRYFRVENLEHFAWPGEAGETRRLFRLRAGRI